MVDIIKEIGSLKSQLTEKELNFFGRSSYCRRTRGVSFYSFGLPFFVECLGVFFAMFIWISR